MTPDLDAPTALLAAATRFPHEDDGYGGCVSCVWMIPNTEDEYERVWYPCPASFLPSLIEAARREAAAVSLLERLRDADVIFGKGDWPLSQEINAWLHDNAGAGGDDE